MNHLFPIVLATLLLLATGCTTQQSAQLKSGAVEKTVVTPSSAPEEKIHHSHGGENSSTHSWVVRSGKINKTFSQAARRAGIPTTHIRELERLFSEQIDFRRDIRKGDHFTVIFQAGKEKSLQKSEIIAAELSSRGEPTQLIRHTDRRGATRYYSGSGEPLEADFLRTPLRNPKVSSHFTLRRFHPVLKVYRPHRGTDFAAPTGTPVMATADGVIQKREFQRGYGNVIFLSHGGGKYTTVYAHLSRIAEGLKKGKRVVQGEVIGLVGSTGMSTGPHLHYEFREDGEHKDAMKVVLPRSRKPTAAEKRYFYQRTAELRRALLNQQKERQLASLVQ